MNIALIDKSINQVSKDFKFRHDLSRWGTVVTVLMLVPFLFTFTSTSLQSGFFYNSALILFVCGLTSGLSLLAYFFLGDSRKAYFKPTHDWMERCELYFDARYRGQVEEFLANGDFEGLNNMPRNHSQQYLVIIYKAAKGNVLCAQIAQVRDCKFHAESKIYMYNPTEHNMPKETSLLDFFYKD